MARLLYSAICSLDGYVADADGHFDWSAPDAEVHTAVNDLLRPVGTQLLGRRMYAVLSPWETMGATGDEPAPIQDFATIWRESDKVVYSSTLTEVSTERTRIERSFDVAAVAELKQSSASDLSIGGPSLAAVALRAGLVDEIHLFVGPVVVGGGLAALPDGYRADLELVHERRFASGVVQLGYRVPA